MVFYENIKTSNDDVKVSESIIYLLCEVTKIVYFIGNERMLIAHDSNRLRFS